mgnify:CR=1 FL=1
MLLASALRPFEAVHVLVVSLPGWEQMAQTVSGCMVANAGDDGTPRNLPSAPTDFLTGFLAAAGGMVALQRRAVEGGSYHVRVSLARTGMYLQRFGAVQPGEAAADAPPLPRGVWETSGWGLDGAAGRTEFTASIIQMTATPPHWAGPAQPTGTSPPEWLTGPRL